MTDQNSAAESRADLDSEASRDGGSLPLSELLDLARPPYLLAAHEAGAPGLQAAAEAIERTLANLDRSLLILLLGGTGVGKSTLLNALAGEEIAAASSVRPCTTETTFYAREASAVDELIATVEAGDARVAGAPASLAGKILVDPPDFDSTNAENRRKLMRLLAVADLVLVVANRIKYRQGALIELLAKYRASKSFAFVLNGCDDPLFSDAVRDDFAAVCAGAGFPEAEFFAVSAKKAFERKLAGLPPGDDEGEFARLELAITTELHDRRIREIKASNLTHACVQLHEQLRRLAGGGGAAWRDKMAVLRSGAVAELGDHLRRDALRRLRMAIFDGEAELDLFVEAQRNAQVDGLFGLYAGVASRWRGASPLRMLSGQALRRLAEAAPGGPEKPARGQAKGAGEAAAADDGGLDGAKAALASTAQSLARAQAFVAERLGGPYRAQLKVPLKRAARTLRDALAESGFTGEAAAPAIEPFKSAATPRNLAERVATAVEEEIERQAPGARVGNAVTILFGRWNIVPNLLIATALYHTLRGFFSGEVKLGLLLFGVVLAVAACAYEYSLFARRTDRERERLREALQEAAGRALDAGIAAEVRPAFEAFAERVEALAARLDVGEVDVASAVGDGGGERR